MFSKKEIIDILKDNKNNDEIYLLADKIRKEYIGDEIHLRALIESSNICKQNCLYCGLQSKNKIVTRYRMTKEEILNCAKVAVELGYKTVVLQSGEDDYYSTEKMCDIIQELKNLDIAVTLSIGERKYEDYKAFKDAGADRYLLRIETTDEDLYAKMHPNMDYKNRLNCLYNLKEIGFEVGTGCLVGLPNQTIESLANDILFFNEIDADMIGIGPFIAHPNTPLNETPNGKFELALKIMAITRIMMKNINIPATTAMETIEKNGRIKALQAGANVVMPNLTSINYKSKYEIYPNKHTLNLPYKEEKEELEKMFKKIGRTISNTKGFRKSIK